MASAKLVVEDEDEEAEDKDEEDDRSGYSYIGGGTPAVVLLCWRWLW